MLGKKNYFSRLYLVVLENATGQAGPKFKTVFQRISKNNSGDYYRISGYFSSDFFLTALGELIEAPYPINW